MRKVPLVTDQIYHIFNRGVNKGNIFLSDVDYERFLSAALHYKSKTTKFSYEKILSSNDPVSLAVSLAAEDKPRIQVIAYCLMPNHFHFLIKQLEEAGITSFIRKLSNSYAHFINVKYKRVGPLFQGRFKNVLIESDDQLIHTSRYIHLNPLVSDLVTQLKDYKWSSYLDYISRNKTKLCDPDPVINQFKSIEEYEEFVLDQEDYGRKLEKIKHIMMDNE